MEIRSLLTGTILILTAINVVHCEDDEPIVNNLHEENLIVVEERLYRHRRETGVDGSGEQDTTTSVDDADDSTISFLTTTSVDDADDSTISFLTTTSVDDADDSTISFLTTTTTSLNSSDADVTVSLLDVSSSSVDNTVSARNITASPLPASTAPQVSIEGGSTGNNESYMENDDNVSITCYFKVSPARKDVNVTWYKVDQVIKTKGRLTIKTKIEENGGHYTTMLHIDPALRRDSGNYSCSVSAAGVKETLPLELIVYEKPRIMLSPSVVSLQGDMRKNLTCEVTNLEDIEAPPENFTWCYNGDVITDDGRITVVSLGQEVLTLNASQAAGTYGCGVVDCTETAEFIIYTDEDKTCESQEDEQGTKWPRTVGNKSLVLACPSGFVGTVERSCNPNGVWEKADYIKCVNEKIAKVNATVTSIREGTASPEEVKDVLKDLSSVNLSSTVVSAGDLYTSIDLVSEIVSVLKGTKVIDIAIKESFLSVVDNIMSADTSEEGQWRQVQQQEPSKAAGLMESVTKFGLTAAKSQTANTSTQIVKPNIILKIGNNVRDDINFPKNSDFKGDFKFPGSNFQPNDEEVTYVAVYYKTMEEFLPKNTSMSDGSEKFIKSDILALAIEIDGKSVSRLFDDVILNFQHTQENFTDPACGYWDFQDSQWKTDGCTAKEVNATYTSCSCNHLTNFAILMSPTRDISEETALHLKIISIVGCSLSILGCVLTIITHLALWRYVRSGKTTILMHLCVCLTLAYTVFLAGVDRTENKAACTAVAALLHYFFLAAFFLMLAEGIEIAIQIRYIFKSDPKLRYILPLAWGLPAVVVGVSLGITRLEGYGNENYCWLTLDEGLLYAFVGPALAVILINSIVIIATIKAFWSSTVLNNKEKKEKTLAGLRGLCVLMPVLGVTWVLGVLSVNEDSVIFQYLFAIFNTLQGFLIFLLHTLMNRAVHDGIRRRKYRFDSQRAVESLSFYQGKANKTGYESKSDGLKMTEISYSASHDSLYGSDSDSREMPETWHNQVIEDESYPLPRVTIPDSASVPPVTRASISIQDSKPVQEVDYKVYRSSYAEESPRQHSGRGQEGTTSFQTNDDDVTRFTNRIQRPSIQPKPQTNEIYSRSNDEIQPLRIHRSTYSRDIYLAERLMPHRFSEEHDVIPQRAYSNNVNGSGDDDVTDSPSERPDRPFPVSLKRSSDYTVYRGADSHMPSCYSQRQEEPSAKRRQRSVESVYVSDDHLRFKKPAFKTHL